MSGKKNNQSNFEINDNDDHLESNVEAPQTLKTKIALALGGIGFKIAILVFCVVASIAILIHTKRSSNEILNDQIGKISKDLTVEKPSSEYSDQSSLSQDEVIKNPQDIASENIYNIAPNELSRSNSKGVATSKDGSINGSMANNQGVESGNVDYQMKAGGVQASRSKESQNQQKQVSVASKPERGVQKDRAKDSNKDRLKRNGNIKNVSKSEKHSKVTSQKNDKTLPSKTESLKTYYKVQIGAYSTKRDAIRVSNSLKKESKFKLLKLFVDKKKKQSGIVYTIKAGPFKSKKEATAFCSSLKSKNKGCFIVTY